MNINALYRRREEAKNSARSTLNQPQMRSKNSDWNEIVKDEDRSVFYKLFEATQKTSLNRQAPKKTKLIKKVKLEYAKRHPINRGKEDDEEEVKGIDKIDKSEDDKQEDEDKKEAAVKMQAKEVLEQNRRKMFHNSEQSDLYQYLLPNQFYNSVECSDSRVYGGKFTSIGNIYYASSQSHIMLYDTHDPYNWRLKKRIQAQQVQWTVTDMDVCANEQYMIYSTISPVVQLVDLETLNKRSERINFSQREDEQGWHGGSGIMSIKFSGDTKEIVAGTKRAEVNVYDLVSNRVCTRVTNAHSDEINSVCFANRMASNIIFTGSDDALIKIWDRRALGNNRAAGAFIGHAEGITHVASKGDGIYLASNGKDQLLKIWDLRKMIEVDSIPNNIHTSFDYRWQPYPLTNRQRKRADDHSVFTFKGHDVLQTLIRCQFSPAETTGQRYVYTGSANGRIFIYDLLTGEEAMVLKSQYSDAVARDVSWHPKYPIIASTSFSGDVNLWTLQNHKKQEPKMKKKVKDAYYGEEEEVEDEEVEVQEEEIASERLIPSQPIQLNRNNILQMLGRLMGRRAFNNQVFLNGDDDDESAEDIYEALINDNNIANEDDEEDEEPQDQVNADEENQSKSEGQDDQDMKDETVGNQDKDDDKEYKSCDDKDDEELFDADKKE